MRNKNILENEEDFCAIISRLDELDNTTSKIENCYLFICTNGCAQITVNLNKRYLSRNSLIVLFPMDMVSLEHKSDDFLVQAVIVNQEFMREAMLNLEKVVYQILHKEFHHIIEEEKANSFKYVMHVMRLIYQNKESLVRRELFMLQFRSFFLATYDAGMRQLKKEESNIDFASSRSQQLFRQFINLVFDHSNENREVQFYADKICITPKYLNTIVKQVRNQTAKSVIDERVIMQIKIALRTTNKSIQQISDEFNFPNQSFFGRYFHKFTGISPTLFRKNEKYK